MKQLAYPKNYGRVIAVVSFLMVFTTLGFCNTPKSFYLAVIPDDIGVPRSLYSITESCRYITYAVLNIFFGRLVRVIRPRRMVACGFVALIASVLVSSYAVNLPMFYLGGVLLGVGLTCTTTSAASYLINEWFTGNTGTILGVVLASSGLGGMVCSQILRPLIFSETDPHAWRGAYRIVAVILLVIGVLIVLLLRDNPASVGQEPVSAEGKAKKKRASSWIGIETGELFRKPFFYLSLFSIFLYGMSLQAINGVSSAHLKDVGIAPEIIGSVVTCSSFFLMVSKTSVGALFDRVGLRITILISSVCAVIGILLLAFVSSVPMAFCYSFFMAFSMPLETVLVSLTAMELVGQKSYSSVLGIYVSASAIGFASGSPILNLFYDLNGSYKPVLLMVAGVIVLNTTLMMFTIGASSRIRAAVEAKEAEK